MFDVKYQLKFELVIKIHFILQCLLQPWSHIQDARRAVERISVIIWYTTYLKIPVKGSDQYICYEQRCALEYISVLIIGVCSKSSCGHELIIMIECIHKYKTVG